MILNSECSGSGYGSPFLVMRYVYFTLVYNKTVKQAKRTNADECFFLFIFIGLESLFGDAASRTGLLSSYFFNQRNKQLSELDFIVLSWLKRNQFTEWGGNSHPTDRARSHQTLIRTSFPHFRRMSISMHHVKLLAASGSPPILNVYRIQPQTGRVLLRQAKAPPNE